MKRFLAILTVFLAIAAHAQSDPLPPGLHEAESDTLLTAYSGTGWTQVVDGAYIVMESAEVGDSVSFVVSGSQLVIYRELLSSGGGTAEICVDALCGTFTNASSVDQRAVPVAYTVTDGSAVTVENTDGGIIRLDTFMVIAPAPELTEVPAPDPAREYFTLDDGTLAAFDRTLRGVDILNLAFLGAVIVLLVILIVVQAWKD